MHSAFALSELGIANPGGAHHHEPHEDSHAMTNETSASEADGLGNPPAALTYKPNAKHKEPWQPGRKGSLCPKDLSLADAARLLKESQQVGTSRWAVSKGRAFKAKPHEDGKWHGWPVGWVEVPASLRIRWVREGAVSRSDVSRFWSAI
jgi:hypothetical protein